MNKILLQLNEKTLKTLGMLLGAGLIILGLFVSVSPIQANIAKTTSEIAKLNAQKAQIVDNIDRYSAIRDFDKELDLTSVFLSNSFPETSGVPELINDISEAATSAGMSASSVTNVTVGTPTQIVEPLGESGNAICNNIVKPGDFAKIIPDIKNSTPESTIYIMCTEEPIKGIASGSFYNAATEDAARTCIFSPDLKEGKEFYIKVEKCGSGAVLPALKPNSVQPIAGGERVPLKPILSDVVGEVAQMQLTITIDSGVDINTIAGFVNNLYNMNRAVTISSIKTGVSADREKTTYTVISGYVYSHTKTITADSISEQNGEN